MTTFRYSVKEIELEQRCDKFSKRITLLTPVLYDLYDPAVTGYIAGFSIYFGRGRGEILVCFKDLNWHQGMMDIEYLKYKIEGHDGWLTFDEVIALP